MQKTVRMGKVADQDEWRREDCMRMTPNERVAALLRFRAICYPREMATIERTVTVRRLGPKRHG